MSISNMPAALQPLIQQNFLEREFKDALFGSVSFLAVADSEPVAINVGETVTKTRMGLKAPAVTPLNPASNTNLDNGITASSATVEQYVLALNMYGDSIDLNVVTSQVGIANQAMANARINGRQALQTLSRLSRNVLFTSAMGLNTRVRTTLGAPAATINVDDIRGFQQVSVNGVMTAVSVSNPLSVQVGANIYLCTGSVADGSNVTTTLVNGGGINGVSGTLTMSTNVSVSDGTAGNAVTSKYGPSILRPNNRATAAALVAGDKLTLAKVQEAVSLVRNNTGMMDMLNLYLDNASMLQLWADADFKSAFQGQYGSAELRAGLVFQLSGVNFIPNTDCPVQPVSAGVPAGVRRPLLCAPGCLIKGDFQGMEQKALDLVPNGVISMVEGIAQVTRGPVDRLQQIVAQSWYWIGGFAVPTDVMALQSVIPTASETYWKRFVMIEHAL